MDKILTLKEKILLYLEQKNIKKGDFFEELAISAGNFKGKNLTSQIGGDALVKILTRCSDLSAEWLMRGLGTMIKDCETATISSTPGSQENTSVFLDKIAEQAEEIGRLKLRIEQLERSRGDNAGHAQSSDIANVG